MLRKQETAYRNQLNMLHQILSAISPKRAFTIPSPRQGAEDVATSRRSSRSPPSKIRVNRTSVESVSVAENSNQSSQDFWVADIQGK